MNSVGHHILSVVEIREDPPRCVSACPDVSASFSYLVHRCPDLADGGLHLPYTPDGLYRFETPRTFAACEAVTPGDAQYSNLTDPEKVAAKLHVT